MESRDKIFSWRWDIDHLYCLEKGVPNILRIAKSHDVHCSFYINLGTSVNLSQWLLKSPRKTFAKMTDRDSIHLLKKIGPWEIFRALFFTKNVGLARVDILRQILEQGHELGVHGIFDHLLWSRKLDTLSMEYLSAETEKVLAFFQKELGFRPTGFTAPGFRWNEKSLELVDCYYQYAGDVFGEQPFHVECGGKRFQHLQIPVTICGPRTIPMIEYLSAKGLSDADIALRIQEEISSRDFAVIYGHPCYEGLKSAMLEQLFSFVTANRYSVMTCEQIYETYRQRSDVAVMRL
jgi:peptidoglycan/xylan/chitin deacetylase (PgdA/CDA1 family)